MGSYRPTRRSKGHGADAGKTASVCRHIESGCARRSV
nr:MAG TPA: hypothetical protein [Caudoviricetes sp.]